MSRYKWYRASWSISLRDIASHLKNNTFKDGASDGFVLDRVFENLLEGRYIERFDLKDEIFDPFGAQLEFFRVEFRQSNFKLFDKDPKLELKNETRGALVLLNKISEAANHEFTIEPYHVDVLEWIEGFKNITGLNGYVNAMQIGSIEMGKNISARTIVKGKEDVRETANKLTENKTSIVEKAQFKFVGSRKGSITLSHAGGAIVKTSDSDLIVDHIRNTIGKASAVR